MDKKDSHGSQDSNGARRSLGVEGERVAVKFLECKGYRILAKNYRSRAGEIDIIALHGETVIFCEVKTSLMRERVGDPREGYKTSQQDRLVRMSEKFLSEKSVELPSNCAVRFDFMIIGSDRKGRLIVEEHLEDAFRPK